MGEHKETAMKPGRIGSAQALQTHENQTKCGCQEKALPGGETAEDGIQIGQDGAIEAKERNDTKGRKLRRHVSQSRNYIFDDFMKTTQEGS